MVSIKLSEIIFQVLCISKRVLLIHIPVNVSTRRRECHPVLLIFSLWTAMLKEASLSCCSRAASLHFHVFVDLVLIKLWTCVQGLRNIIISLSQQSRVQDPIISSSKAASRDGDHLLKEQKNLRIIIKWSQINNNWRQPILQITLYNLSSSGSHHPLQEISKEG